MTIHEMMTMVGRKRFITLAVLAVIGGMLGGAWHYWLTPEHERLERERRTVQGDRTRLQTEIRGLPEKYAKLLSEEARYDVLVERGFMAEQDRILARRNMDALRTQSGLRGVTYDIEPQKTIEHPQSYALNMNVVTSGLKVKFLSLSDIEVRNFLEEIQKHFGGLIVVKDLSMKRKDPLNDENLRKLSAQQPVDFIEGEATFDWYNIVPKPAEEVSPEAQAFGGGY